MPLTVTQLQYDASKIGELQDQAIPAGALKLYQALSPQEQQQNPLEICKFGLLFRLDLLDAKLSFALHHLEKVHGLINDGGTEKIIYLNACVMELWGINDLIVYELAHYYGVFYSTRYDWSKENTTGLVRGHLGQLDPRLGRLLTTIHQEFWCQSLNALRNYIVHRGSLTGVHHSGVGTPSLGFVGVMGADEIADTYLQQAQFTTEAHLELPYFKQRSLEFYNGMVSAVDRIREYCTQNAPLFDTTRLKFQSLLSSEGKTRIAKTP